MKKQTQTTNKRKRRHTLWCILRENINFISNGKRKSLVQIITMKTHVEEAKKI